MKINIPVIQCDFCSNKNTEGRIDTCDSCKKDVCRSCSYEITISNKNGTLQQVPIYTPSRLTFCPNCAIELKRKSEGEGV